MLDHLSIQCADLDASKAFYDAVLATLGGERIFDFGEGVGYGIPPFPDFWIGGQQTGDGFRESHIAFTAPDRATVRTFFDTAVAQGAEVLHEPASGPSTTSTTTARSSATPTATTSRPSATYRSRNPRRVSAAVHQALATALGPG